MNRFGLRAAQQVPTLSGVVQTIFNGLNVQLTLTETQAPTGFQLLPEPITVDVTLQQLVNGISKRVVNQAVASPSPSASPSAAPIASPSAAPSPRASTAPPPAQLPNTGAGSSNDPVFGFRLGQWLVALLTLAGFGSAGYGIRRRQEPRRTFRRPR